MAIIDTGPHSLSCLKNVSSVWFVLTCGVYVWCSHRNAPVWSRSKPTGMVSLSLAHLSSVWL